MQPDNITLQVDALNDGTNVQEDFEQFERRLNNVKYTIDGTYALDNRNEFSFYRTFPKQSGNFKGVGRSAVKFTQDQVVLGVDGVANITAPIICEISFSVPVGATSAAVTLIRQRAIALLDSETIMDDLNVKLMI